MTDNHQLIVQKLGRPYFARTGWLEFDSATGALLVMVAVFVFGVLGAGNKMWESLASRFLRPDRVRMEQSCCGSVLVVGMNSRDQNDILLTVSPRGYQPVFVVDGEQALLRIHEENSFKVAVIDQNAPGARRALDTLRHLLPLHRVIELRGPVPSSELAQLLLNAL